MHQAKQQHGGGVRAEEQPGPGKDPREREVFHGQTGQGKILNKLQHSKEQDDHQSKTEGKQQSGPDGEHVPVNAAAGRRDKGLRQQEMYKLQRSRHKQR